MDKLFIVFLMHGSALNFYARLIAQACTACTNPDGKEIRETLRRYGLDGVVHDINTTTITNTT